MKDWRIWAGLGVAVVLLAGGIYLGYTRWVVGPSIPDAPQSHIVPVRRGPLVASVQAVGMATAPTEVALSFGTAGRVTVLRVVEGDAVEAGDVLAQLDATDLELRVAQAEVVLSLSQAQLARAQSGPTPSDLASARAALAAAQANVEQLKAGPLAADLASAEAALTSAQAAYQQLVSGPSPDEMAAARTDLEKAELVLRAAQTEYDKYAWQQGYEASPQAAALQQATLDYDRALASYRIVSASASEEKLAQARAQIAQAQAQLERAGTGATGAEMEGAQAQVAKAQADLDRLQNSPTAEDLAVAQAQVRQAEIALQQAQRQVEAATLTAPVPGIVASVGARVGESVSAATPAVELVDLSSLCIQVGVSEADIGEIAVGQEATIRLEAYPGQELAGQVAEIAPVSTLTAGVVNYPVRVELNRSDVTIRPGMDAEVQIVTAQKVDALLVPRGSLRLKDGLWMVWVVRGGAVAGVSVTPGERMGRLVEVSGDLAEGESVVVGVTTPDMVQRVGAASLAGLVRRAD